MMTHRTLFSLLGMLWTIAAIFPAPAWAQAASEKATFRVKYIAQGAVYLDGGRAAGLKEGQRLIIERAVAKPAYRLTRAGATTFGNHRYVASNLRSCVVGGVRNRQLERAAGNWRRGALRS